MKSRLIFALVLILVSAWWAWTFLVDFFIIKTVFTHIDDFWKAGQLGMAVFTKLNNLELVTATVVTGLLAIQLKKNKSVLPLFIISLVTWSISLVYFSYLTPKIIDLTDLWHKADLFGLTAVSGIPDIQQEHQFYHNMYIGIDSMKLTLLTIMMGLGVWKQEKMF